MNASLFDTHAHLDDERFSSDLPAVLERARVAQVERIITIGIDVATSRANVLLASKHTILRSAVGIQPNHVAEAKPSDWDSILELVNEPNCVAVGETGLDRYWDRAPFDLQEEYFARHLELRRRLKKPIIIHCREAETDIVRMLQTDFDANGPIAGILHSYTGDLTSAEKCVAMGLCVSFAGMLTYKSAENIRQVAAKLPLERLLVETDSPYLAPVPQRGKRNEPGFVRHTLAVLAEVQGISVEQAALVTTANARRIFGVN